MVHLLLLLATKGSASRIATAIVVSNDRQLSSCVLKPTYTHNGQQAQQL